ncbi:MAG: hypothetical protein NC517_04885 [Firmicutes bacterium]|nr:hypothetical protein [Bacillota bacterium]
MKWETAHFDFYYSKFNADFARSLSGKIEDVYVRVAAKYGICLGDERYDFYLCATVEEYIRRTGKKAEEYQEWMLGWAGRAEEGASCCKKRLCLLRKDEPEQYTGEYLEYLTQIMIHEVTHIVFDQLTDNEDEVICWLAEGIAVMTAGQTNVEDISQDEFPLIRDIDGRGDCDAFYDNGGYDYAGVYVSYFIKKFGVENFVRAYRNEIDVNSLIYDGFEKEAILDFLTGKHF